MVQGIETAELKKLLNASIEAKEAAYAPYSNFRVGAALLCDDGTLIKGCNVENASYGAGICAERTALVSAVSQGRKDFRAIAVSSDVPSPSVSPCGICRQFIREFCALSTPIYMVGSNYANDDKSDPVDDGETMVVKTLEELLPMSFGPEFLGKKKI